LAREADEGLEYAGTAFVTLSAADRERFWRATERLATGLPALSVPRPVGVSWMKPELRVTAKHLRGAGKLRHATLASVI
jgi:hypothetical protein